MNTAGPVIRAHYLETEEYFVEAWDRNPRKQRMWTIYAGVVIGLGVIVALELSKPRRDRFWWFAPAAAFVIAMFAMYWLSPPGQRRQIRRTIRKRLASPPAEAWFEFSDAGFLSTGRDGRSGFHPWSTVAKVVQLPDGLLLYFDENYYHWVPQRAFGCPEDYATVNTIAANKAKLFQRAAP
ncbi:MAG TPA: YcxB family protein [Verrucomicrobiae bacterium]|nr:YcxB family protein [Verrucomicrobiae bacterium]